MANSVDANSAKCFSGVIGRLLCGGSLPTHPSDQFVEYKKCKEVDHPPENALRSDDAKVKAAEAPGVVARLMGLDSIPGDIKPKDRSLASYFRSRSVNSIDFLAQFDVSCKQSPAQHRRVRTAASLSEVPSLDFRGKHDFNVILHFEQVENCKDEPRYQERLEVKKPEVMINYQQAKQKKVLINQNITENPYLMNKSCKKLEDKPKRVHIKKNHISRKTNVDLKERRPAKSHNTKKKENKYKECNPRNSCSFSVFDNIQDYQIHPEATPSEVSPVRQVSNKPLSHCNYEEFKATTGEHDGNKTMKEESSFNIKLLEKICNLTEYDLKKSCWVPDQVLKFEDLEEICFHYGQQIFELLLNQVVDELVLLQLHRRKEFFSHMHVKQRDLLVHTVETV
ncbi:uncharacterized protein LOC111405061 [Olea europaea var. sylvestris]|uniref:uncharacterized protein LOC111405061 n=1 Tax=Olea europaea var. sylvestris TaxID=158386 RepID=UPI000C1D4DAE|nr:uncharacterized protein LOC111405061 [Olea europaea var. sylvestris]